MRMTGDTGDLSCKVGQSSIGALETPPISSPVTTTLRLPDHTISIARPVWRYGAILAALLILGIMIRLLCAHQSLWIDEIASVNFADQPLSNLWSDWMRRETNPPLYYTILKGWTQLIGPAYGDQGLRSLSILYGCGSTILAYFLGRKVAGNWAGLAAAALMTVSPAQVHYSLELRAFAQAQFAALAAILCAIHFLEARTVSERWAAGVLYVISTVAALYSHTTVALLPLLVNLGAIWWIIAKRKSSDLLKTWIAANLVIILAWIWWLSITLWQVRWARNLDWIVAPTLSGAANQMLMINGPGSPFPQWPAVEMFLTTSVVAVTAIALGRMIWRCRERPALILAICAIGAPCLLFLISSVKPVMIARAFFWTGGAMLVCVAIGLADIRNRTIGLTLFALLFCANLAGSLAMVGRADGEPYEQIVMDLKRQAPNATVITDSMETALALKRYCAEEACSLSIFSVRGRESWTADIPFARIEPARIPALLRCAGTIFTVQRPLGAEKSFVPAALASRRDLSLRYGLASYIKVAQLLALGAMPPGAQCRGIARHSLH